MTPGFAEYTEIAINALEFNPKSQDVIYKKQEILKTIETHQKNKPTSILFVGFNPMILVCTYRNIYVTEINEDIKNYLNKLDVKFTYIDEDELGNYHKKFDWVIAVDEYLTFASSEDEQKEKINLLCSLAKSLVVTTLRDYKNQDFKDREFSQPLAIFNKDSKLFVEYHNYDYTDKNSWKTSVYELCGESAILHGPFDRRVMFFKQMANFSIASDVKQFYVHKNLMYKSVIRKNYEHIISLQL